MLIVTDIIINENSNKISKNMCDNKINFQCEPCKISEPLQFEIKSENCPLTDNVKEEPEADEIKSEEVFIKEEDVGDVRPSTSTVNTDPESGLIAPVEARTQKLLECYHCGLRTNRNSYFEQHMNIHTKQRPFKCNKCNFQTAWKMSLKKHLMIHVNNEMSLKPKIINNSESNSDNLNQRNFIDTEKIYDLYSNTMIGSPFYFSFKCDKCSYVTVSKRYLLRHMIMQHRKLPFECDVCGYKTAWSGNLQLHKKIHTEGKFFMKCSKCNYRTTVKKNYDMHIPLHEN